MSVNVDPFISVFKFHKLGKMLCENLSIVVLWLYVNFFSACFFAVKCKIFDCYIGFFESENSLSMKGSQIAVIMVEDL